ncbi:MAG: hypothetical protein PF904_09270 [Kiritimatiellae bacterium]|jgi:hypothetical protein|nr:hypothetical protein [Kiritimatiellia bacterium]
MKRTKKAPHFIIILSVMLGSCLATFANLATNGNFEATASWNIVGNAGYETWAQDSTVDNVPDGTRGVGFYGWEPNGSGYFEQHVDVDTNATYYFRIRGLREENFDTGAVDMRLRFFDNNSNWSDKGTYSNANVNLSSSTGWTTYEIEADAPVDAGIVQMRCDFSGSAPTGGNQGFKWDNATLYDRRKNYRSSEIVDEFSYDPDYDDGIDGKNRGNGFSQAWSDLWGTPDIEDESFETFEGYPKTYGNKLHIASTGGGTYRKFDPRTTGAIYASAYFNYNNEATYNWAGISLMSNEVERVFFGGNSDSGTKMKLSIASYGGATIFSDYTINSGLGTDYILFCKYDFTTHIFTTKAYYKTIPIPLYEPNNWDTSVDLSGNPDQLAYINGIRLAAGGTNPGDVYFDEVRVSDSWYDLLNNEDPRLGGTVIVVY